jgi:hypothetical protein
MRKFNLESKDQTIINFYYELKYCLGLIIKYKDIGALDRAVLKAKTKFELDQEVKLKLHQYFEYETTVILHIATPTHIDE